MSLDVYLTLPKPIPSTGSGIFVRINGQTKEISREEWDAKFPEQEPVVVQQDPQSRSVFSANITHNLGAMAREAGIYQHLWRPEELGITKARELIEPLCIGLMLMKREPERFKEFNAPNGWGTYKDFIPWIESYLSACCEYPEAEVEASR